VVKNNLANNLEIQEKVEEILSALKSVQSDIDHQDSSLNNIMINLSRLERTIKSDRNLRRFRFDKRIHLDTFLKSIQSMKSQLSKTSKDMEKVCASHKDSSWIPEESVFE
jgi:hypothetical protein